MLNSIFSTLGVFKNQADALCTAIQFKDIDQVDAILNSWFAPSWDSVILTADYLFGPLSMAVHCPAILSKLLQHYGSQISPKEIELAKKYAILLGYNQVIHQLQKVQQDSTEEPAISLANTKVTSTPDLVTSIVYDDYPSLPQGPLNKSLATQELEAITKIILKNSKKYIFSLVEEQLFVQLDNKTNINLSTLLKNANLAHIELSEVDSNYLVSKEEAPLNDLPEGYCLPGKSLTHAEQLAIARYTLDCFYNINDLLHGKLLVIFNNSSEELRDIFLNIMFIASGLNKISPTWVGQAHDSSTKTYRGEGHISQPMLKSRIEQLKSGPLLMHQPSFASTSSDCSIGDNFSNGLSRIDFDTCYGKPIQLLSQYKGENEYLLLPGQFYVTGMRKQNHTTVFDAQVVTPLVAQYRSINQQNRFKKIVNKWKLKNMVTDFAQSCLEDNLQNMSPHCFQLCDLLEEADFVYQHYYNKPFTDTWYNIDWELPTPNGLIVRPNHGLAHVMRVAHLVPVVAEFLKQHTQEPRFVFAARDIYMVQLAALFSVSGRRNEAGFLDMKDNEAGYKVYKQASSDYFEAFATKANFLNITPKEIRQYYQDILTMGAPDVTNPTGILLALAHKLDLLRCFSAERAQKDIIEPFNKYLPLTETQRLIDFAEALLHATGDRVFHGAKLTDYALEKFYKASTNPKTCLEMLLEVNIPSPDVSYRLVDDAIEESRPANAKRAKPAYSKVKQIRAKHQR